jgi:hypothetical protein
MEYDFSIRKEVDGLNVGDPSIRELLNSYKLPPQGSQPTAGFSGPTSFSGNDTYLGNLLGQIQGSVAQLSSSKKRSSEGLQLSIDPEVLRWIVVLSAILLIVWLFFKAESAKRKRNPLNRRLKRLEKQVRRMSSAKRKALRLVDDDDDDDDLI